MIKTLLNMTLALFCINTSSFGQTKRAHDYIVLTKGDTLYGTVAYLDTKGINPGYSKKIKFTTQSGNRKSYKKKDVLAFRSEDNSFEGFWLSQSSPNTLFQQWKYTIDPIKGEKYFLKIISKGRLNHYRLEWWEQGESLLMTMDLFKKMDESFLIRADQGLLGLKRKVLINYFKDCPTLCEQIKNKNLSQTWELVDYYNANCE